MLSYGMKEFVFSKSTSICFHGLTWVASFRRAWFYLREQNSNLLVYEDSFDVLFRNPSCFVPYDNISPAQR